MNLEARNEWKRTKIGNLNRKECKLELVVLIDLWKRRCSTSDVLTYFRIQNLEVKIG